MEERRLLLAVALSLLVLAAYSMLFPSAPAPQPTPLPPPSAPAAASSSPPAPAPAAAAEAAVAPPASAPMVADESERRVEVTALGEYTVAFSNKGARLVSWTLTRHKDSAGRPVEMVPAQSTAVRPLDIETGDPGTDARLREALFKPSSEVIEVGADEPSRLSFSWSDGSLAAEKTLEFRRKGLQAVSVAVRRDGQALPTRLVWGPGLGNPSAEEKDVQGYQDPAAVALVSGEVEQYPATSLPEAGQTLGAVRWTGVQTQYFAALFVPASGASSAALRSVTLPALGDEPAGKAAVAAIDAPPGQPVLLFVGAKDWHQMAGLGHELQRVVPVGDWIGPIVVPLISLLRWVHSHVGNWGWSIVLITILINVAMAPFRHYSIVNGMKMAKLSPEMRAIQERYRKVPMMDPRRQQMQEEIGALYARHGMSMGSQMAVGCLPLLLTMPFLFAFYRVLTVLVDLRGAPFLWIGDLAHKDPFFITPVLMGVSMFVMQKMTPSAMDPAQQRIMMLMPLMLAGMFLWAPAGLNLYWLTSNLWSILQQGVSMRLLRSQDARPARERRAR